MTHVSLQQTVISDEEVVSSEIEVETVPIDSIDINTIPVIDDDVEIIGETVVESEVIEHIPIEDSPLEGIVLCLVICSCVCAGIFLFQNIRQSFRLGRHDSLFTKKRRRKFCSLNVLIIIEN